MGELYVNAMNYYLSATDVACPEIAGYNDHDTI